MEKITALTLGAHIKQFKINLPLKIKATLNSMFSKSPGEIVVNFSSPKSSHTCRVTQTLGLGKYSEKLLQGVIRIFISSYYELKIIRLKPVLLSPRG